jgi:hypothetical protein
MAPSPFGLTRLSPLVMPGLLVRCGRHLVLVDLNEHNMIGVVAVYEGR